MYNWVTLPKIKQNILMAKLLQTMEDAAADTNRMKVRDMLGSFFFRGDDVEKGPFWRRKKPSCAICKLLCSLSIAIDG
jgi:hypothetical protein